LTLIQLDCHEVHISVLSKKEGDAGSRRRAQHAAGPGRREPEMERLNLHKDADSSVHCGKTDDAVVRTFLEISLIARTRRLLQAARIFPVPVIVPRSQFKQIAERVFGALHPGLGKRAHAAREFVTVEACQPHARP
jgi:hypothetical protein